MLGAYILHCFPGAQEVLGELNVDLKSTVDDGSVLLLREYTIGNYGLPCNLSPDQQNPSEALCKSVEVKTHRIVHEVHVQVIRIQLLQGIPTSHLDVFRSVVEFE
jgi:hypothetical protein